MATERLLSMTCMLPQWECMTPPHTTCGAGGLYKMLRRRTSVQTVHHEACAGNWSHCSSSLFFAQQCVNAGSIQVRADGTAKLHMRNRCFCLSVCNVCLPSTGAQAQVVELVSPGQNDPSKGACVAKPRGPLKCKEGDLMWLR